MVVMDIAAVLMTGLWVWFIGWAVALSVVDLREHRLPNRMVGMCLIGAVAGVGLVAWTSGDWGILGRALVASLVTVTVFVVGHVVGGMGMGDVKYSAVTGLVLGSVSWSAVWWGHTLGFAIAGVVVAVGMLAGRLQRRTAIPFGPYMATGAGLVGVIGVAASLPVAV